VATRRWVWRQTNQSIIDEDTKDFYLNIDALEIIDEKTLRDAISRAKDIICQTFGKDCKLIILSATNPIQVVAIE
jgi:DNA/RNA-binding domain of Phe-tRNA-synthetase-like protein